MLNDHHYLRDWTAHNFSLKEKTYVREIQKFRTEIYANLLRLFKLSRIGFRNLATNS